MLVLTRSRTGSHHRGSRLSRTHRGLISEVDLTVERDGVPSDCIVNFDNVHTLPRSEFRRHVTTLSSPRMAEACRALAAATGC